MNTVLKPPRYTRRIIRLDDRMKRQEKIKDRMVTISIRAFWRLVEQSLIRLGICCVAMFLPLIDRAAIAAMALVLIMFAAGAVRCLYSLSLNSK